MFILLLKNVMAQVSNLDLKDQGGELGVGRGGRGHPVSLKFCVIFKKLSEK